MCFNSETKSALRLMIGNMRGKRRRDALRNFCRITSNFQKSVNSTGKAFEELTDLIKDKVFSESEDETEEV